MRFLKLISVSIILLHSCNNYLIPKLGEYRAEIRTKDNSILPFKFELVKKSNN